MMGRGVGSRRGGVTQGLGHGRTSRCVGTPGIWEVAEGDALVQVA
jgi:hypothetical protein